MADKSKARKTNEEREAAVAKYLEQVDPARRLKIAKEQRQNWLTSLTNANQDLRVAQVLGKGGKQAVQTLRENIDKALAALEQLDADIQELEGKVKDLDGEGGEDEESGDQ